MANVKITELTAATALAGTDVLPIVDVGADATKKVSVSDLLRNLPDGTASAPALAFADDQNTGVLSPGNNSLAFATSGTQRLVIDSSGRVGVGITPSSTVSITNVDAGLIQTDGNIDIRYAGSNTTPAGSRYVSFVNTDTTLVASQPMGGIRWVGNDTSNPSADSASILAINQGSGGASSHITFNTGGTERLRIDSSGNVGVGITPTAKFHVGGTIQSQTGSTVAQMFTDGGAAYFTSVGAYPMLFQTNGSERARIDSSGRLLVGTTTEGNGAADNLTVADSGNCGITIRSASTNSGSVYFSDGTSGDAEYRGYIQYQHPADVLTFATTATERMRIDSSGVLTVGSGANTATQRAAFLGGYTAFENSAGTGNPSITFNNDTDTGFLNPAGNTLAFNTGGTERMRIASDGAFDHFTSNSFSVRAASTSSTFVVFRITGGASSTSTGTSKFVVRGDGDAENTNGTYTTISDSKFKENVVDAESQWEDLKAVRVRNFNFKEETNWSTHKQIGFVAQELEAVCPNLVKTVEHPDEDSTYKTVKTSVLYTKAVKALQEAMDRIETLEAKVAALEAQ